MFKIIFFPENLKKPKVSQVNLGTNRYGRITLNTGVFFYLALSTIPDLKQILYLSYHPDLYSGSDLNLHVNGNTYM